MCIFKLLPPCMIVTCRFVCKEWNFYISGYYHKKMNIISNIARHGYLNLLEYYLQFSEFTSLKHKPKCAVVVIAAHYKNFHILKFLHYRQDYSKAIFSSRITIAHRICMNDDLNSWKWLISIYSDVRDRGYADAPKIDKYEDDNYATQNCRLS
jgi:hypothetical protein